MRAHPGTCNSAATGSSASTSTKGASSTLRLPSERPSPGRVVVAIHGAIDDAGLICSAWRIISDVYPFVVCPSGNKVRKDTYVWPSSEAIAESAERAVALVRARYGDRVRSSPAVYVAFSQGANMAGPVLGRLNRDRDAPGAPRFARAVLTEGGYHAFDAPEDVRRLAQIHGSRVLFTCSQLGCAGGFAGGRAALERAGSGVRVVYAGPYGHSMLPAVRESIHAALAWTVEDLEGWETYPAAPKLAAH